MQTPAAVHPPVPPWYSESTWSLKALLYNPDKQTSKQRGKITVKPSKDCCCWKSPQRPEDQRVLLIPGSHKSRFLALTKSNLHAASVHVDTRVLQLLLLSVWGMWTSNKCGYLKWKLFCFISLFCPTVEATYLTPLSYQWVLGIREKLNNAASLSSLCCPVFLLNFFFLFFFFFYSNGSPLLPREIHRGFDHPTCRENNILNPY